jgi:hypothetical protein
VTAGRGGAARRAELILDALAARRAPPREAVPEASTDRVAELLAALAADVDHDLPAGAWLAQPWLTRQPQAGQPQARQGAARRRAARTAGSRRRMRATAGMGVAAAMLTAAIVMVSADGPLLPGPFSSLGPAGRQAAGRRLPAAIPSRHPARRGTVGQGAFAALPGVWMVPVSGVPARPGPIPRRPK